jgi:hypothetical protein
MDPKLRTFATADHHVMSANIGPAIAKSSSELISAVINTWLRFRGKEVPRTVQRFCGRGKTRPESILIEAKNAI